MSASDLLEGLQLPFSAVMEYDALDSTYLRIVPPYRNSESIPSLRLWIPPGVSILTFVWDGPMDVN